MLLPQLESAPQPLLDSGDDPFVVRDEEDR